MEIRAKPNNRFLYTFEFDFLYSVLDFCRALKVEYGVKNFCFLEGHWRFSDIGILEKIQARYPDVHIDYAIDKDIEKYKLEKKRQELKDQEADRIKQAKDSNIVISGLKMPLYDYQKVGVEFLVNAGGRALLADAPGVGKSAQAIAYAVHTGKEKTLVICPASVKYSWESEVKKWSKLKPLVIDSTTNLSYKKVQEHDVFVINYDLLRRMHDDLKVLKFDCVIIDEVQYIKSPSAVRSRLTRSLANNIPSAILLSGTPILNRPVELFNGLQIIDGKTWSDYYAFTARYCEGHRGAWGWEAKGSSNIEELHGRIKRYFLRRTKKDVLKELPPKTYIGVPVELDPKIKKDYDLAERNFVRYLKEVKKQSASYGDKMVETIVKLGELRQLSSRGKIESAKELIENILDNEEKVCVFSVYNAPLEQLAEYFGKKAVLLTGKTSVKERPKLIKKFQESKEVQVFLGGLVAAGAGITLTAATNVVFIDYSYVPADHRQGEDRIHRPGQTASSVSIYQLYAKDTIDDKMRLILEEKQHLVDTILEGKSESTKEDVIKKILEQYEE